MFYAMRETQYQRTLTEFDSKAEFLAECERLAGIGTLRRVDAATAREYVKRGGHHETALWTDMEGKVRRAQDGF